MTEVADAERVEFTEQFRDKEIATFPVVSSQRTLHTRIVPSSRFPLSIIHPSLSFFLSPFSTLKDGASSTVAAPCVTSRSTSRSSLVVLQQTFYCILKK